MKIKQINDPDNLIHSAKLLQISEYDYKLIVQLNKYCEPFRLIGSSVLNIIYNYDITAEIKLDFCGNQYDEYESHQNGIISYIFDNNMQTKLATIINHYEQGESN